MGSPLLSRISELLHVLIIILTEMNLMCDTLLLNTEKAAVLCGLKPGTLRQMRMVGTGPSFLKLGRLVRYRPETVAAWVAELPERKMTSR